MLPKAAIGPLPINCPTANSIYSMGTPHIVIIKKYGMRNTPGKNINNLVNFRIDSRVSRNYKSN